MRNKTIYLWVNASNPYNSILIQVRLVSKILSEKFGVVSEILHPDVPNFEIKLKQISENGDIIFWHYGGFDRYLFYFKNKSNLILSYHNITPARYFIWTQPLVALLSVIGRLQLTFLNKQIKCVTESTYNSKELHNFGFNNVSICPNIITVEKLGEMSKSKSISLLYVGRISPNKNCIRLLEEVEKIANFLNVEVNLVIVGAAKNGCLHGRRFQEKYTELLKHPFLRVLWMNSVSLSELHTFYRQSWLYVSMALHEGFGVPACESIAHGTPALYVECGGQESILNAHGMVPLEKINCFAEYAIKLLANQEDRDGLYLKQLGIVKDYLSPAVDQKIFETYRNFIM